MPAEARSAPPRPQANVRDRLWEFGVLRALGAGAGQLVRAFVYEAVRRARIEAPPSNSSQTPRAEARDREALGAPDRAS